MEERTKFCYYCKQNKNIKEWTPQVSSCKACRVIYDRSRRLLNKVNKVNIKVEDFNSKGKFCNSCKQSKTVEYWTSLKESKCRECRSIYDRNRRLVSKIPEVKETINIKKLTNEEIEEFLKD